MKKKLLTLALMLGLVGSVYAAPVVSEQDGGDTETVGGTIGDVIIPEQFFLTIVGSSIGPSDTQDVGGGLLFGAIDFNAAPAAGNDGVAYTDPEFAYLNMARRATDRYNEHLIFITNNRGAGFTVAQQITGTILDLTTPGDNGTAPFTDAFGGTWDGSKNEPIHITAFEAFDAGGNVVTVDVPAIQNLLVPVPAGANVILYDTDLPIGDAFSAVTAMDFVAINPTQGTYSGNVAWVLDSKL